jgi:hypothetical protein
MIEKELKQILEQDMKIEKFTTMKNIIANKISNKTLCRIKNDLTNCANQAVRYLGTPIVKKNTKKTISRLAKRSKSKKRVRSLKSNDHQVILAKALKIKTRDPMAFEAFSVEDKPIKKSNGHQSLRLIINGMFNRPRSNKKRKLFSHSGGREIFYSRI